MQKKHKVAVVVGEVQDGFLQMCRMKKHEKERRSFGSVDSCLFHYEGRRPKETSRSQGHFTADLSDVERFWYCILYDLGKQKHHIKEIFKLLPSTSLISVILEWHTGHTECSLQQLEDWPHLKRSGLWIIWGCHLAPEAEAPEKLRGPDWSFVDETHSA